jgi:hypothetical protein
MSPFEVFIMSSMETLSRFVAPVEANAHIEAVEEFYAEDSSVREKQTGPRVGRDLHMANEHRFLSALRSLTSKCVRPLTSQRWEGGRIAEATFFFDPAQRVPKPRAG